MFWLNTNPLFPSFFVFGSLTTSTRVCMCCEVSRLAAWRTSPRMTSVPVVWRRSWPCSSPSAGSSSRPSRRNRLASVVAAAAAEELDPRRLYRAVRFWESAWAAAWGLQAPIFTWLIKTSKSSNSKPHNSWPPSLWKTAMKWWTGEYLFWNSKNLLCFYSTQLWSGCDMLSWWVGRLCLC